MTTVPAPGGDPTEIFRYVYTLSAPSNGDATVIVWRVPNGDMDRSERMVSRKVWSSVDWHAAWKVRLARRWARKIVKALQLIDVDNARSGAVEQVEVSARDLRRARKELQEIAADTAPGR